MGFYNIKISLKASSVPPLSIKSYEMISNLVDYPPLHVGITESGPIWRGGTIKSAVGIGTFFPWGDWRHY